MKIRVFPLTLGEDRRIGVVNMAFHPKFPRCMKRIPGSRWTPEEKCWHIPYTQEAYARLREVFGPNRIEVFRQRPNVPVKKQSIATPQPSLRYAGELTRLEQRLRIQRYSCGVR